MTGPPTSTPTGITRASCAPQVADRRELRGVPPAPSQAGMSLLDVAVDRARSRSTSPAGGARPDDRSRPGRSAAGRRPSDAAAAGVDTVRSRPAMPTPCRSMTTPRCRPRPPGPPAPHRPGRRAARDAPCVQAGRHRGRPRQRLRGEDVVPGVSAARSLAGAVHGDRAGQSGETGCRPADAVVGARGRFRGHHALGRHVVLRDARRPRVVGRPGGPTA